LGALKGRFLGTTGHSVAAHLSFRACEAKSRQSLLPAEPQACGGFWWKMKKIQFVH
jgi:hypothetical protein